MVDYIYNTSGETFVEDVFDPKAHPSYLREKAVIWGKSPVRMIGLLDEAHLRRLLAVVRVKCEAKAIEVLSNLET